MRAVADCDLQSRHVVASTRFVEAVTQATAAIASMENVREKKRQHIDLEQEASETSRTLKLCSCI